MVSVQTAGEADHDLAGVHRDGALLTDVVLRSGEPLTCQHDDCTGYLLLLPGDEGLPPHVEAIECETCGEVYLIDTDTGEVEVDA